MPETQIESRLNKLKEHLKEEHNILHDVVDSFSELDEVGYKLGLLSEEQSYATRLSWWPMISILGIYSAGKSTFINNYLGQTLQRAATQAVDDKFTVICFSSDDMVKTLPGIALDADPRFPFYKISGHVVEKTNNNQRIDAYLQLKTCHSEQLRGKILIDSPGFDADQQRTSTLRISQHIIDLSDLVLVFFDARHPEPGAMHDTLEHLVSETIDRPDSNKFLYILNQMDIAAREDNPEEVVAAWQRSLAQAGLTAGRFYRVYNPQAALPIEDAQVRERIDKKCQVDMKEIHERMEQVGVERAYRVISMLEHSAKDIEHKLVPQLRDLIQRWKKRTFWSEIILGLLLVVLAGGWFTTMGTWSETWDQLTNADAMTLKIVLGVLIVVGIFLHVKIAKISAQKILKQLQYEITDEYTREGLMRAFGKNTGTWRALFIWFINQPVGWGQKMHLRINNVLGSVNGYVQQLNDRFTNPSGRDSKLAPVETSEEIEIPAAPRETPPEQQVQIAEKDL